MAVTNESRMIETHFKVFQADLEDMKASMVKMADALTKIAILEEKHQVMSASVLRCMEKIEKLESEQVKLRMEMIELTTSIKIATRALQAIWGIIGTGVLYGVWQIVKLMAQQ